MGKMFYKLMMFVTLIVFLSITVSAIGLQGSQLRFEGTYVAGTTEISTFTINFAGTDDQSHVQVTSEGDLAEYLHPSATEIYPSEGDDLSLTVEFIMTDNLPEPGNREGRVCVLEVAGGEGVSARTKSCVVYEYFVLYDGIYPSISLDVVESGSEVGFSLTINNYGKEEISSSSAIIDIYSPDKDLIGSVALNGEAIASNTGIILTGDYDISQLTAGDYLATARVTADNDLVETNASFKIGEQDISVVSYTNEIKLNGIQKFDVVVSNDWADSQDVKLKINAGSQVIESHKETIGKWAEQTFALYLDTSDFELGEKTFDMTIFFGDAEEKQEELLVNFIDASTDALAANIIEESSDGAFFSSSVLILVVLLLIGALVVGVLIVKRNSGSDVEDEGDDF